MNNYKKLYLIVYVLLNFKSASFGQSTTINLRYIEKPENRYTKFQQYQKYTLEDYPIVDAPLFKVKENIGSTTYSFQINEPSLLNLGFHCFYIEPTDSISIDYHLNSIDENQTPDESINILTQKGLLILKNGASIYDNTYFYNDIKNLKNVNDLKMLLSDAFIQKFESKALKEIYDINKNFKPTLFSNKNLEDIIFQGYLKIIASNYEKQLVYLSNEEKKNIQNRFFDLLSKADDIEFKSFQFYSTLKDVYDIFYRDKWKNTNFNYDIIEADLKDFEPLSKEYFLLLVLKKDLISAKINDENLKKIKQGIHEPTLVEYAKLYTTQKNIGRIANGYISNNLRNTKIFDTNNKDFLFGELFSTSKQPFLYFDFCGSWCKPCLEEIEEYSKTARNYDHSAKLKPIWLFFENNDQDWLKTVARFNLPKQNCFMVKEKDIQGYFSKEFEWEGEFPHHFVFRFDGYNIDNKAASLLDFKEYSLESTNNSLSIPPPPMLYKKN